MHDEQPHVEEFNPLDPELADVMWDRAAEIRERCPVSWSSAHGGFWMINRYDDVWDAALNWQRFTSAEGAVPVQYDLDVLRLIPLETDPPLHREVRAFLNPFFTPEALKATEPAVRTVARELIERCTGHEPCDFVTELCSPFPAQVFFELFLREDPERIAWVVDLLLTLFTRPEAAAEKVPELMGWCVSLLEARRAEGRRDDLIGTIAHAGTGPEFVLSDRQRTETLFQMLTAGMETTASALASVAYRLARNPSLRSELGQFEPVRLDRAVDEFLRLDSPVPTAGRTLTEDVELGGCPMRKGDRVLLNWGSANRDPRLFPEPETLDLDRPNAVKHVAFGAGIHRCLGSHLARREIRVMIEALCALERFELLTDEVHYRPAFARGPVALPVRCVP